MIGWSKQQGNQPSLPPRSEYQTPRMTRGKQNNKQYYKEDSTPQKKHHENGEDETEWGLKAEIQLLKGADHLLQQNPFQENKVQVQQRHQNFCMHYGHPQTVKKACQGESLVRFQDQRPHYLLDKIPPPHRYKQL